MSKRGVSNRAEFDAGMNKAKKMIYAHLERELHNLALVYLADFVREKGFNGFTGNTQTSYACGVYVDGLLRSVVYQSAWGDEPVRMKVRKGEVAYLEHPYEGRSRVVFGIVNVDDSLGKDSSLAFLNGYKGAPKKGLAVVCTTGTEYSEYIESVYKLNVMTSTWLNAGSLAAVSIKPM